ncbi:sialoadhesin-like [Amphiprion ocellaris]|uniref:sialoadhesin-like n=1 Tax=Amphiprion ocellaris TaxID=80972 RepID=UPI002410CB86|nr:sialoadhesin-like [Amphiprion ocellaris]
MDAPKVPLVLMSSSGEIMKGSSVTLTCSSDANPAATYTWYKENEDSPNASGQTFATTDFRAEHSGNYYCEAQNTRGRQKSTSHPVFVAVAHSQNWDVTYTQLRMCGPKGSAVDMNCSYTYPAEVHGKENIVQTKFWYVGRKEDLQRKSSSYEGRVHYDWHYDSDCTLRITDLRVEDSAVYKFRFITNLDKFSGEPGVTLTVTVIDIRITSAGGSSTKAELRCESHCSPDDHVWLKNGQQVSEGITYRHNFQPEDNICCALKGHEDHCSPSLYAPKLPSVSVSPSAEIVEGSSVNLTCNGEANPAATYTWFKVNDRDPLSQTPQLNFRSIRSSESGQYSCTATNALGNTSSSIYINVKCERDAPKVPLVLMSSSGEIMKGSSVTLTCSSDANPAATYTWYKENEDSPNASGQTFATTDFRAEHSGNYYCEAQNTRGRQKSTSHPVFVAVAHSQNWDVTYTQLRMCGPKGSAVDMNCSYTYPAEVHGKENIVQTKFWYVGRKEDLQRKSSSYEGRVHYDWHYDSDCTLRITDLRVEDSAVYKFRFITNLDKFSGEPGVTLTVTVIDIRITSAGGSSTKAELRCESHCSPDDHVWLKNGQQVSEGITYRHNFQPEDNICCALKGHEDHCSPSLYAPKLPSVSVSPSAEIVEGSSVNLTCNGEANPAATYTWFKVNDRDPLSQTPQLNFRSIRSSESGQYSCTATNALGNTSSSIYINVKCERDAPKLPSVSVSPSAEIVEGSSVNLTCSSDANPVANYTWYKENEEQPLGPGSIYNLASISSEDKGNYCCKSENKHGQSSSFLFISVQYAPKLPSVSGSVSGEGSSVTLTCSSDANPAANYTWYKENEDSPKASGQTFTISDDGHEQSGNYQCKVQNSRGHHSSTLHLVVVQISPEDPGVWKTVAGTVIAILLVVLIISITLWNWKKTTSRQQTEPTERPDESAQVGKTSSSTK